MLYDERISRPLKLDFNHTGFEEDEPFVIYTDYKDITKTSDYFYGRKLLKYYFCVSDELKELLEIYATGMSANPFFITNEKEKSQKVYWKVDFLEEDILRKKPFMSYKDLVLEKVPKDNPYIFKVSFDKQQYIIVSLHLAENILRKNFYGIQFIPIKQA